MALMAEQLFQSWQLICCILAKDFAPINRNRCIFDRSSEKSIGGISYWLE